MFAPPRVSPEISTFAHVIEGVIPVGTLAIFELEVMFV